MPTPARQTLTAADSGLYVEFAWRGDRYQHVIAIRQADGTRRPLLESVEGSEADDWPPSPPLQSLTIEELANGRTAALLVGMAGRSHWSASIEATPGGGELVFDLACRHSGNCDQLSSRYRWLIPADQQALMTIAASPGRVTDDGEVLTISPASDSNTKPTARWRFVVSSRGAPSSE
jgi:hypothetical protein